MILLKRVLPFGIAGVAGFIVDAGVLYATIGIVGYIVGRILSFSCAVFVTWLINRSFAFADRAAQEGLRREFMRYFFAMIPGSIFNWVAYAVSMNILALDQWSPVIAVAIGSIAGMSANIVMANYVVFTNKA